MVWSCPIFLWVNPCAWSAGEGGSLRNRRHRRFISLSPEKLPQLKRTDTHRLREPPKYTCPTPPPIKKAPAALLTAFSYSPPGRQVKLDNKQSHGPRRKVLTWYYCRHRAFHMEHRAAQWPWPSRARQGKRQQLLTSGDAAWVPILMCSSIFEFFF